MFAATYGVVWLALVVGLTAGVLRVWPGLARAVIGAEPADRQSALDGLRGLLALSVILHHGIIAHDYFGSGRWEAPPAKFDNLLGQGAVALFFMSSAYLFWGRIIRRGTLDWNAFYRGRVRRLVPMYVATILLLLTVVAVETGFSLRVGLGDLLNQVARWFTFAFADAGDINGLRGTGTILSVIWTLRWEWMFYLALPFFAFLYGAISARWLFYGAVLIVSAATDSLHMALYFASGGMAVHAVARWQESWWGRRIASVLGLIAGAVLVARFHDAYGLAPALLLFPVFLAALLASGPWSILRWRPLVFLGHISYSVYLLHNPLIHIVAVSVFGPAGYATLGLPGLYLALLGVAGLTVAASTATYLLIEKPFLGSGKALRWLAILTRGDRAAES